MSYAKYAKYAFDYIYLHIIHILHVMHISYRCTWSGRRMLWTLIPLLSRGIGGKPKEVYYVSWYSYRKRAILSGSTESTAYLPISPALPCRIISHLKALTPVVSATSSQEVCNEASNLGAVPYVDLNACKNSAWHDGIWNGIFLGPAVCSEGHTLACPVICNIPVVYLVPVLNSRCKMHNYE